jgi:sporulation protein YlmC with PRC-barrel domain
MERRLVYVSRLVRLALVGADGAQIGRMADVVLGAASPRVNGFVVRVQRRSVFVGAGRVAEIAPEGVRLRRGAINLRQFALREGEQLIVG